MQRIRFITRRQANDLLIKLIQVVSDLKSQLIIYSEAQVQLNKQLSVEICSKSTSHRIVKASQINLEHTHKEFLSTEEEYFCPASKMLFRKSFYHFH